MCKRKKVHNRVIIAEELNEREILERNTSQIINRNQNLIDRFHYIFLVFVFLFSLLEDGKVKKKEEGRVDGPLCGGLVLCLHTRYGYGPVSITPLSLEATL